MQRKGKPLSREEVVKISDAVRDKFVFIAQQMEDSGYIPDQNLIHLWKKQGILARDTTILDFFTPSFASGENVWNHFVFGRFHLAITNGGTTYQDILDIALNSPLLKADDHAIKILQTDLKNYILNGKKLSERSGKIHEMLIQYHSKTLRSKTTHSTYSSEYIKSHKEFARELYQEFGYEVDWEHFAYCKIYNSTQRGECLKIIEVKGPDTLVYKAPLPSACSYCKMLYLENDGTPKVFRAFEMLSWGTNHGRKRASKVKDQNNIKSQTAERQTWKPVAGLVHPWCNCGPPRQVTGFEPWLKYKSRNE